MCKAVPSRDFSTAKVQNSFESSGYQEIKDQRLQLNLLKPEILGAWVGTGELLKARLGIACYWEGYNPQKKPQEVQVSKLTAVRAWLGRAVVRTRSPGRAPVRCGTGQEDVQAVGTGHCAEKLPPDAVLPQELTALISGCLCSAKSEISSRPSNRK